jgi:hypothetical protein
MEKNHKTYTAELETAFGKKLDTKLSYTAEWDEYKTHDDAVADGQVMSNEDQLKYWNNKIKASAKAAAVAKVLSDNNITRPAADDPAVALENTIASWVKMGIPADVARAQALKMQESAKALAEQYKQDLVAQ